MYKSSGFLRKGNDEHSIGDSDFPWKEAGVWDKGKTHRYFCNVLALKLAGRFISDQFIIKLHKVPIFLHICWKFYIMQIKGKTNCNQLKFTNWRTVNFALYNAAVFIRALFTADVV